MRLYALILSTSTAVALSACAYVIPPESNAPRHNMLEGPMHRPQLNNSSITAPQSSAAPAQQLYAPQLPPVDASTQAKAEQILATQAPIETAVQAAPVAPTIADAPRRRPIENGQFELSANSSYPSLNDVPVAPALQGEGSAHERLSNTQSALEQDRVAAGISKDALARDAAAEPSMLSPLPQVSAPVQDPAPAPAASVSIPAREDVRKPVNTTKPEASRAAPVVQAQAEPMVVTQAVVSPARIVTPSVSTPVITAPVVANLPVYDTQASLPATAAFAPPAPLGAMPAATVTASTAPVALGTVSSQPSIIAQALPAPVAASGQPTVRKGDFDPLAVADNAPVAAAPVARSVTTTAGGYARNTYLAPSRYADRRY